MLEGGFTGAAVQLAGSGDTAPSLDREGRSDGGEAIAEVGVGEYVDAPVLDGIPALQVGAVLLLGARVVAEVRQGVGGVAGDGVGGCWVSRRVSSIRSWGGIRAPPRGRGTSMCRTPCSRTSPGRSPKPSGVPRNDPCGQNSGQRGLRKKPKGPTSRWGPSTYCLVRATAEDTRFELVRGCPQHAFQFCAGLFSAIRTRSDLRRSDLAAGLWTHLDEGERDQN